MAKIDSDALINKLIKTRDRKLPNGQNALCPKSRDRITADIIIINNMVAKGKRKK